MRMCVRVKWQQLQLQLRLEAVSTACLSSCTFIWLTAFNRKMFAPESDSPPKFMYLPFFLVFVFFFCAANAFDAWAIYVKFYEAQL